MHRKSSRTEVHTVEGCVKWAMTPQYTLQGRSRAADRSGFAIVEAGIFFDAGLSSYMQPKALLLTHSHTDHSFALPMLSCGQPKPFPVYAPTEAIPSLTAFLVSTLSLADCEPPTPEELTSKNPVLSGISQLHGLNGGETFKLVDNKSLYATAIKLKHRVPAIGYCVFEKRTKLLEEYATLSGKEIGQLRKEGKVVSKEVEVPICAYLTDTHVDGLAPLFEPSKPALAPFIIVECTYINGIHPESDRDGIVTQADTHGHVDWARLAPIIKSRPEITFALIHWSMRYKEEEIKAFFEPLQDEYPNILLWFDTEVWTPSKKQEE